MTGRVFILLLCFDFQTNLNVTDSFLLHSFFDLRFSTLLDQTTDVASFSSTAKAESQMSA